MDENIKKILQTLDDGTRLLKGEWTSDGRKIFRFLITEILLQNSCAINENDGKIKSGIKYCLSGKGNPSAIIWIYRLDENQERTFHKEKSGIGEFKLPITLENDTPDENEEGYIELYLNRNAFENFVLTINSLLLKGTIKFLVMSKKQNIEESEDSLIVTEYSMENCLSLKLET